MAYNFKPYLSLPSDSKSNPFFISTSYGGLSHCIDRNGKGYTLPNCVALVHAEVLEVVKNAVGLDKAKELESKLCRNNANVYWGYTQDGLKRGQTPKLGAIACWSGGKNGAGHVAFVTGVAGNNWSGRASNYSGSAFYTCSYSYSSTYKYYLGNSYSFQGFIYLPYDFSVYCTTPVEKNPANTQIKINIDNLNVRSGAGTSYGRLGYAEPGFYNVISVSNAADYTWYQIESGKWVANAPDGDWVTLYPKQSQPTLYDVTFRVTQGDVNGLKNYGKQIQVEPTITVVK